MTSALSAGLVIHEVLSEDSGVASAVTKIFPVMTDSARLPYIAYRRNGLDPIITKAGHIHRVRIEILCMSERYSQGVEIAEKVKAALDGKRIVGDSGLVINICTLVDAVESWAEDAFVQSLTFEMEINPA